MTELAKLQKQIQKKMKNDPAHDFAHIMRVYKNAQKLCKAEKINPKLVLTAVLLHDIIKYPKTDKRSKQSSIDSAKLAKNILKNYSYSANQVTIICDAIKDHSYSQNKIPQTIEGKILQDADRLDALGAVGIARVFAVSGSEGRPFYNNDDPFCTNRTPNDTTWTLDHFYQKLLKLEKKMNTKSAKIEAKRRTKILKNYLAELKKEI